MVTREDIINIARLSKLYIAEEDLDDMTKAMDEIVKFADSINSASEKGVEEFDNINNLINAFREDTVVPSYDRDEILKNANDTGEGHFLVRKRV
ncbi:MAG: Asp-tRNA(Asn)/Glu-tRNA(Gln) amidotransferase subunit GatC [Clostridia bacterium]|nr:Asp-tRNA(Asn)/Glu-tRNA(Gln) amidotransferase subunit GatC [Clostridia bacterium]